MCTAVALEIKHENMLKSETQAVGFIRALSMAWQGFNWLS